MNVEVGPLTGEELEILEKLINDEIDEVNDKEKQRKLLKLDRKIQDSVRQRYQKKMAKKDNIPQ